MLQKTFLMPIREGGGGHTNPYSYGWLQRMQATFEVKYLSLAEKDSPLHIGFRKVVCSIWSQTLQFGIVRLIFYLLAW